MESKLQSTEMEETISNLRFNLIRSGPAPPATTLNLQASRRGVVRRIPCAFGTSCAFEVEVERRPRHSARMFGVLHPDPVLSAPRARSDGNSRPIVNLLRE